MGYRVFIALEVIETLRTLTSRERPALTRFIEGLAMNPSRVGDYTEQDETGRPIQVVIVGRHALCFWADHPVNEIKVIDLRSAGN